VKLVQKKGGYAEFSVNVRSDAPDGTEIINFATVYFPSVPEITRTNGIVSVIPVPTAIPGDFDGDNDVDRNDLNFLLRFRNQPATACPECDIDGDGKITVLDARKLVLLCTRPRCATE